jgi:hypothetical protein
VYKVDPRACVFACNLLTKNEFRAALFDEVMEGWPQVPLVSKPSSLACRAERLTRTGTSPNRSVIRESGAAKREAPNSDAGEEVALREAVKVSRSNVLDASLVNDSGCDVAGCDEVAQPLCCAGIVFVVIGWHRLIPPSPDRRR